jgi:hypothetical protein
VFLELTGRSLREANESGQGSTTNDQSDDNEEEVAA